MPCLEQAGPRVLETIYFGAMILVKLQGGLGNQLFQYAAGRSLIAENENVYLDHNFFNTGTSTNEFIARRFELGIFKNLKVKKAGNAELDLFLSKSFKYRKLRCVEKKTVIISQQENEFIDFEKLKQKGNIYLIGFFQSEKYFLRLRNQLLHELQFPGLDNKNLSIKNSIQSTSNPVSIHIRRTDYLIPRVSKVHGVLPLTYYYRALDELKKRFHRLDLFFFSDDIDWVIKNFRYEHPNKYYVSGNSDNDSWKDMALMSYCKHHIVANSSFSWWGAWLSTSDGLNFAPYKWVNPEYMQLGINDFIPEKWQKVYYE
jgi:hypothetical protein